MSETQAERRSTINHELFSITAEMKEAMEKARISELGRFADFEDGGCYEGKNNFRAYDQNQSFFITVTKDKFLDAGHPAAIIDTIIERLDLETLYVQYSKEGNPPYHPKMMLKIVFYGYYTGIMSCRTIWDSVTNRSDFMYLAAGQVPNFRTINDFRLRHLEDLPGLFTQIVFLCEELDMLDFEHMAVDGQKIQASANYKNSKNLKGIKKEYAKVKEGMRKLLEKEVNEYFTEATQKRRVSALEQKMDKLGSFQKVLEELNNEDKRINMVDPDAPIMTHKDGQKLPSYSHQSARDGKCGVVTAVQSTQNNDLPQDLLPLVSCHARSVVINVVYFSPEQWEGIMVRYRITLTEEERKCLKSITSKGKHRSQKVINALILLNCDEGAFQTKRSTNEQVVSVLKISMKKIDRVKKRFVEEGLYVALNGHKGKRVYEKKADGDLEAHLVAISCSEPPEGFARWSLRALADRVVELNYIDNISYETVRRVLKKTKLNRGKNKAG